MDLITQSMIEGLSGALFFCLNNHYITYMIPDSVKLFFLDVDHVIVAFFAAFFLSEVAMLYMFPWEYYWIPIATIVVKFGLIWCMPEKAGRWLHFIMLTSIAIVGYGVLLYMAPTSLWFSAAMVFFMLIILIGQFSGITPDAEDRVRTRTEQKEQLWYKCRDIEYENKDD